MVKSSISLTVVSAKGTTSMEAQNLPVKLLTFNDGGVLVEFSDEVREALCKLDVTEVWVTAHLRDSDGLVALPSVVSFIRSINSHAIVNLSMPYLPHARQDRYTGNNAFTFKHSVAPIINECNFNHVHVMDAHNASMLALFTAPSVYNAELINQIPPYWMEDFTDWHKVDVVISPDAGAVKNSEKYAKLLNVPLGMASKSRNPDNGHIVFNDVYGPDVTGKTVLIVDDLIEGGATVLLLAKKLKENGATKVLVMTTHGLFPKGFDHLLGPIDRLYAYYSWVPQGQIPKEGVEVAEYF